MSIPQYLSAFLHNNIQKIVIGSVKLIIVIVLVIFLRFILTKITQSAFAIRRKKDPQGVPSDRVRTLLPIVLSAEKYILYFIALIAILRILAIDTSAILASAGILGLAGGFAAQSTVKDFISGFFLLFDGIVKVGDVITIGNVTGEVEKVDLRNTYLREFSGRLWTIPNGDIRTMGNFNREWVRAVVEVGVAYEQEVEKAMQALQYVADKWAESNKKIILESPSVQGINTLGDSSVVLRIVIKLQPLKQWTAERELKRMIKDYFDQMGVEIPFPRRVVYNKVAPEQRQ